MNPGTMAGIGRIQSEDCLVASGRDTPEVVRAMNNLNSAVERYDNLVHRLQDKISCVTTCPPPQGEVLNKEIGYQTELANSMDLVFRRLRDITNNLESLYERIEL